MGLEEERGLAKMCLLGIEELEWVLRYPVFYLAGPRDSV